MGNYNCIKLNESLLANKASIFAKLDKIFSDQIKPADLEGPLSKEQVGGILTLFKEVSSTATYTHYSHINQSNNHVFTIGDKAVTRYKIKSMIVASKLSIINYNIIVDDVRGIILLVINWNLSPVKPKFLVHGKTKEIFSGSSFIRNIFNENRVSQTSEMFKLNPAILNKLVEDSIPLLIEDIKHYWYKTELTPQLAAGIGVNLFNSVLALLYAVSVKDGVVTFKTCVMNNAVVIEGLDAQYTHYGHDHRVICSMLIYVVGELIERVADQGYSHLFKGCTNNV